MNCEGKARALYSFLIWFSSACNNQRTLVCSSYYNHMRLLAGLDPNLRSMHSCTQTGVSQFQGKSNSSAWKALLGLGCFCFNKSTLCSIFVLPLCIVINRSLCIEWLHNFHMVGLDYGHTYDHSVVVIGGFSCIWGYRIFSLSMFALYQSVKVRWPPFLCSHSAWPTYSYHHLC